MSKFQGNLADGRPFEALYDGYQDAWYVIFTFSSEGIESYKKEDLIELLVNEIPKHMISKSGLNQMSYGIVKDEFGNEVWSLLIELDD